MECINSPAPLDECMAPDNIPQSSNLLESEYQAISLVARSVEFDLSEPNDDTEWIDELQVNRTNAREESQKNIFKEQNKQKTKFDKKVKMNR